MANYTDHYKIKMDADVTVAKKQVQDLYNTISLLSKANPINNTLGGSVADIKAASAAASELEFALKKAVNVETGKLNLKTFNNQLLRSGKSLKDYQVSLNKIGPEGQKVFRQLAQAVMTAEKPMFNFGNKLKELGESMGNTIRWQISSSVMNGLIGAVQKATNHVKILNKSLNDIRIVTGASAEKMDQFADKANKAAQRLNVATTAYTDASLIFYQQGLSDDEVEKRTETVLKLSNVTGESAEDVSSYMTAIWNNFADGSKELEYYADVMTRLGAATAASTDEIAAGLDKFAAVSDTIGLSYEYATSALATVVAETRQSADVVGTAFKTIFTRLEGLQLGDTLEDGTTLNKYSAALATVGVNIKDTSGELKDMDMILDELGVRWKTLAKDEQVALAQTVAGTRQYTQLIALMENYDKFKGNVNLAEDSSGTLQDQADIYADSWEAASKRVRASAEDIYQSLLDDDFFIGMNNGFATVLDSVDGFIESMGGLKGILPVISTILLSMFGDKLASGIDLAIGKFRAFGQTAEATRRQAAELLTQSYDTSSSGAIDQNQSNFGQEARLEAVEALKEVYIVQGEMYNRLNEADKQRYDTMRKQHEVMTEETMELGKQVSILEKRAAVESKRSSKVNKDVAQQARPEKGLTKEEAKNRADQLNEARSKALKVIGREDLDKTEYRYSGTKQKDGSFGITKKHEDTVFTSEATQDIYKEKRLQLGNLRAVNANVMNQTGLETEGGIESFIKSDDARLTEDSLKNIGGTNFSNLIGSLEKTKKGLDAVVKSTKKSGKSLEAAFGKEGGAAIKQYKDNVEKAEKAAKKMQQAQQKMAKISSKTKKSAKDMKEYAQAEQEAATEAQNLKDAQEKIATASKGFSDAMKTSEEETAALNQAMKAAGIDMDSFDKLADKLGISSLELAQKLGLVEDSAKNMQNTLNKPLSAGQIVQNLTTALSGAVAAANSLGSIWDIWANPDASGLEKVLSTIMALTTAVGSFLPVMTAMNTLTAKSRNENLKDAGAKMVNKGATEAQAGADTEHTSILWGKSLAQIAANPWMIGAVVAAVAVGIALVKANARADEEHTKALEEKAAASNKANEAAKEEVDRLKELTDAYYDAKTSLDETAESKEALRQAALDLVDTYGIENGYVLVATNNYTELEKSIRAATKAKLDDAKVKNEIDTKNQGVVTGNKLVDEYKWAKNWGLKSKGIDLDDGGQKVIDQIAALGDESLLQWNGSRITTTDDFTYSAENLSKLMEQIRTIQEATYKTSGDSEAYQVLTQFLQGILDSGGTQLDENNALALDYAAQQAGLEFVNAQEGNQEPQSFASYYKKVDEAKEIARAKSEDLGYKEGSDEYNQILEAILTEYGAGSADRQTWEIWRKAIDEQGFLENDDFLKWFNDLTQDQQMTALSLRITPEMDEGEMNDLLETAEEQVKSHKIYLQAQAGEELSDLISKGLTAENISDAKAKYIELMGSDEDWNEFLVKDKKEQLKIVQDTTKKKQREQVEQDKKANDEKKAGMDRDEIEKNKADKTEELQFAQQVRDKVVGNVTGTQSVLSVFQNKANEGAFNPMAKARQQDYEAIVKALQYSELTEDEIMPYMQAFGIVDQEGVFNPNIDENTLWNVANDLAMMEGLDLNTVISKALSGKFNDENFLKFFGDVIIGENDIITSVGGGGGTDKLAPKIPLSAIFAADGSATTNSDYIKGLTDEINDLESDLDFYDSGYEETAESLDNQEMLSDIEALNEQAEALDINQEALDTYTQRLIESSSVLKNDPLRAKQVALAALTTKKGLEDLSGHWEDYGEYVKDATDISAEAAEAFSAIRQDLSHIFNIDADLIKDEDIAQHYDLIQQAAKGSLEAVKELESAMAQEVIFGDPSQMSEEYLDLFEQMENTDIEIGARLNTTEFADELVNMVTAQSATVDEMQKNFDSLGWNVGFKEVEYTAGMNIDQAYDLNGEKILAGADIAVGTKLLVPDTTKIVRTRNTGASLSALNKNSGGGGGEKKKVEDEVERYHQTERTLSRLERLTKNLSDAKNEAFGQEKIDLINAERYALEQELKTYQALDDEILKYLAQDKANIAQYGATFDDYGNISNYEELVTNMVNRNIAGEISNEEFDQFQKWLSQYEETLDKWYDNQDSKREKERAIVEKEIEAIDAKVEIKLHLSERELQFIEKQLERLEDQAFSTAEKIDLIASKTEKAMENSKTYQQGIKDLQDQAAENLANGLYEETGGYSDNMRTQMEEYSDGLLEQSSILLESKKEVEEMFGAAIDETSEVLDEQIGRFDSYGAVFENYKNILGLSGKSVKDAALMIDLGNKSVQNSINKLESTRKKQETLQSALNAAEAELLKAQERGDSESVKYWEEEVNKITIQVEEGMSDLTAAFEETLQAAADNFAAAVEQTVAVFSGSMTRFKDLDIASDHYEKQKTLAEQYLDVNTQNYELSKLMRNINAEIDKTDNLAAKVKLRDVLEEINEIQANNAELSQYDLDMLNAKYQLKLAEIALEEAQNAKSQVRLTQTAGGGWGYVYTADQNTIDKAEQNYEDKLYEIQKLSQDRMNELSDNILQNYQEYRDAVGALKAEDFENKEAYMAEVDRLTEYYTERDKYLQDEFNKAVKDSGQTYKDTLLGQTLDATSYQEAHERFVNETNKATDSLSTHYDTWETSVSGAYTAAGLDEEKFKNQVVNNAQTIINKSNEVEAAVTTAATKSKEFLTGVANSIGTYQTTYSEEIDEMIDSNDSLYQEISKMFELLSSPPDVEISINTNQDKIESLIEQLEDIPRYIETVHATTYTSSGSGSGPDNFGGSGDANTHRATASFKQYSASAEGSSADNAKILARQALLKTIGEEDLDAMGFGRNLTVSEKYRLLEEGIKYSVATLDTGGYTGTWGAEGKLAMLHEKEIVLNKSDTANLLTSIEIVRSIAQQLDALSQYQRMFDISAMLHWPSNNQPIEQNVYITAEFPDATDRHELEEAFRTLMNYSSQYINRYNK